MELSINVKGLSKKFGLDNITKMLKAAGFSACDCFITLDEADSPLHNENYRDVAASMRSTIEAAGLICNQTHAPFSFPAKKWDEDGHFDVFIKSLEIAAVRSGAYVLLDMCCQAGMVIPCIFAASLLGETVSIWQIALLGALLFAIILLSDKGNKHRGKMKPLDVLLLLVVWVTSGTSSLTIKLYAIESGASNAFFNFVTFFTAAVSFGISYIAFRKKGTKISLPKKHYTLYMPIMVGALYFNIFLQTEASKTIDAMIMFPLQTVLGLAVSMLMAATLFAEKPTVKNIVGMIVAAGAIILMNLV